MSYPLPFFYFLPIPLRSFKYRPCISYYFSSCSFQYFLSHNVLFISRPFISHNFSFFSYPVLFNSLHSNSFAFYPVSTSTFLSLSPYSSLSLHIPSFPLFYILSHLFIITFLRILYFEILFSYLFPSSYFLPIPSYLRIFFLSRPTHAYSSYPVLLKHILPIPSVRILTYSKHCKKC